MSTRSGPGSKRAKASRNRSIATLQMLNDWRPTVRPRAKGVKRPMKGFVKEYVCQRIKDVWRDPSLIHRDRKNVNRIFYSLRPAMQEAGWTFEGKKGTARRKKITAYVREVCNEIEWIDEHGRSHIGIRRADIGIIASDVGYIFFRGGKYSIGLDTLKNLKDKGADAAFIEKEDIALSLVPLQQYSGIALISGRGFSTEYQDDLIDLISASGANVVILTDYEISGLLLAQKLLAKGVNVVRIGIDEDTLDYFGISDEDRKKIDEPYKPSIEHLKHIKNNPEDFDEFIDTVDLGYIGPPKNRRIELDRLIEYVGNERFWEWVVYMVEESFPTRNYWDRGIKKPDNYEFTPEAFDRLYSVIHDRIGGALSEEFDKRKKELEKYEGLIDNLNEYEDEWKDTCHEIIDDHPDLDPICKDLEKILKKYPSTNNQ